MTVDTLKLAHALRDKAGFSQANAEGAAEAINEALASGAATKTDIAELRGDIANVRGEIKAIDSKVTMLMWIVGLNFAATIAVLIKHW